MNINKIIDFEDLGIFIIYISNNDEIKCSYLSRFHSAIKQHTY